MSITQEQLKSILNYNPHTGIFTWLKSSSKIKIGSVAGSLSIKGYIRITINNKEYMAHRLVCLYMYGYMPLEQTDHINHIKSDNRLINLRFISHQENHLNKTIFINNKSGLSGIEFNKKYQKWRVRIQYKGKRYFIGYFNNLEEAKGKRIEAQIKYGFHPNCNKPKEN